MACSGCGKKKKAAQKVAVKQYSQPMVTNIKTRKQIPLSRPLVDTAPPGGWSYSTVVKGVPVTLQGRSGNDVLAKTRVLHFQNGVPLDEDDFWLSANIQWLRRTPQRHHLVKMETLLQMKGEKPSTDAAEAFNFPPSEWGSVAWRFLGLLLAKNHFDLVEFIAAVRTVAEMLDPKRNPSLGCDECATAAAGLLNDIIHHPPSNKMAARIWLVRRHNIVNAKLGKQELTMHEAAKENFWT